MDLKDEGSEGVVWIDVDQNKDKYRTLVNTVMNSMFVDPCIIVQFINKNPTRCNSVLKF